MESKDFEIRTAKHRLKVSCYSAISKVSDVEVNKELFSEMCRKCRNYNNKYSCPPLSPSLSDYINGKKYLFLVLLRVDLKQLSNSGYKEHFKFRIGNAIIKPRIDRIMYSLESSFGGGGKFISSGSCRLCKPCKKKLNEPCKHPEKMRFSLEALGVDCNKLVLRVFKFPLLWYKDKKSPDYTCVVCALPFDDLREEKKISRLLDEEIVKSQ